MGLPKKSREYDVVRLSEVSPPGLQPRPTRHSPCELHYNRGRSRVELRGQAYPHGKTPANQDSGFKGFSAVDHPVSRYYRDILVFWIYKITAGNLRYLMNLTNADGILSAETDMV